MAGKRKRGGRNAVASASNSPANGTAGSSSFTLAGSPAIKASRARKPTQEWIEINSDEEESKAAAPARGVLRGLNPNNVLAPPSTHATVEIPDSDDGECDENDVRSTEQPAHSTRASRYGKAAVSYDMKYHPMDEVTRPKRAANGRSGSRSKSAPVKQDLDDETSDESSQSVAREDDTDEDGPSEGYDAASETRVTTSRAPDPRASRHSGRAEAQKPVNYSRKYHPQDYGLPGYQHRAKGSHESIFPSASKTASKRKSTACRDASEHGGEDDDEPQPIKSPSRPRKKLKSLISSSPVTNRALAKPSKLRKKQGKVAAPSSIDTDELNNFVEEPCRGSQAPCSVAGSESDSAADDIRDPSPPSCTNLSGDIDVTYDDSSAAVALESCSPEQDGLEAAEHEDYHMQKAAVQCGMVNVLDQRGGTAKNWLHKTSEAKAHAIEPPVDAPSPTSPHSHNAQRPLTPTSECRLVLVRPYFTGYNPVFFDPNSLTRIAVDRPTPLVDMPKTTVAPIDHSFSDSSDTVDISHSEMTRQTVLASSKGQAIGTPAGSPPKQSQSTADVKPSSSTLVGASGPVSTGASCATTAAAALLRDEDTAEEPRSDFEEQFSVTDLPLHELGGCCDRQTSNAAYEDLPVLQRERSDEQQPSSSASLIAPRSNGVADDTHPMPSSFGRLDAGLETISQALGTSQTA